MFGLDNIVLNKTLYQTRKSVLLDEPQHHKRQKRLEIVDFFKLTKHTQNLIIFIKNCIDFARTHVFTSFLANFNILASMIEMLLKSCVSLSIKHFMPEDFSKSLQDYSETEFSLFKKQKVFQVIQLLVM